MRKSENVKRNWDARLKLVSFTALILSFSFVGDIRTAFILTAVTLAISIFSGINAKEFAKRMLPALTLMVTFIMFLIFTTGGAEVYKIGGLSLYKSGIMKGIILFSKFFSISIITSVMLHHEKIYDVIAALKYFKVPALITDMLTFSYRYIHTIREDYAGLKKSLVMRGGKINIKNIVAIIAALIIRSVDRAERVYKAMILRGYNEAGVSYDFESTQKNYNILYTAASLTFAIGFSALNIYFYIGK